MSLYFNLDKLQKFEKSNMSMLYMIRVFLSQNTAFIAFAATLLYMTVLSFDGVSPNKRTKGISERRRAMPIQSGVS